MSDNGFIKLTRSLYQTAAWRGAKLKYRAFFMELLMRVKWKETEEIFDGKKILLKPGQYCSSIRKMVNEFNPIGLVGKSVQDTFSRHDIDGAIKYFSLLRLVGQEIGQGSMILTICEQEIYDQNFFTNRTGNRTEIGQKSDSLTGKKDEDIPYMKKGRKEEKRKNIKKEKKVISLENEFDFDQTLDPTMQHNVQDETCQTPSKKIAYREFVFLKPSQYQKLIDDNGLSRTDLMLDDLNAFKGSTGKEYISDYHTMVKGGWVYKKIILSGNENSKVKNSVDRRTRNVDGTPVSSPVEGMF